MRITGMGCLIDTLTISFRNGNEGLLLCMCPHLFEKHFVYLPSSPTPTTVHWLTKEIV